MEPQDPTLTKPYQQALRQRAEALLRERGARRLPPTEALSPEAMQQALHELQVRQVELELQNEELRLVSNNMGGHVSRLDRELRYLFVNDACERLFGKRREVLLRSNMRETLDAKTFAYAEPYIRRVLDGERVSFELQFQTLQGDTVYWLANFIPDLNQEQRVVGFFNITHDITGRKQTERKLQESEARTALLLQASRVGLWDWKLPTNEIYFSREWKRQLGYEDHELPNRFEEWEQRLHPADVERTFAGVQAFLAGSESKFNNEFRLLHKDGSYRWIFAQSTITRSAAGRPLRMMGSHIDITERKRVEARLRVSDLALRAVSQGVVITDPERRILWANDAFTAISGYSLEEVQGQTCRFLQGPLTDAAVVGVMNQALERGEGFSGELLNYSKDGTTHWNDLSISPVRDEAGQLSNFVGITRDVTERKQAQLTRELLERKTQEAQRLESIGVLAGGIAHDFNNLLTGIIGNASVLALELPQGSQLHEYTQEICQISGRAADLCKQMLAYSGQGRFVLRQVDLSLLAEETAQLLRASLSNKHELQLQLAAQLPLIEADAPQMRQVIVSLVTNASEALGAQGGTIRVSAGLARLEGAHLRELQGAPELTPGEYLSLEVADNGCGMSDETQAKIFDPFFTTKFTGRGLGLAAVLGIVRGHKGGLQVHSALGQGTNIRLFFPVAESASSHNVAPPQPEPPRKGPILVVDDDAEVRKTLKRILKHLGVEAVVASDGHEAVTLFREDPSRFSLVLLDLTMPNMGGLEAFAHLKRLRPAVRVVLMSGYNQKEALARFPGEGPDGFLEKPFTLDALAEAIKLAQ